MQPDDGVVGWIHRYAHRNFWRVPSWYDYDDLVQDGFLHWARIVDRYKDVKDRRHLMSLFQVCYVNHIHNLSNSKTGTPEIILPDLWDMLEDITPGESNVSFLKILISEAPDDIAAVFKLFNSEDDFKKLRSRLRVRLSEPRETWNDRICRLAGLKPGTDIINRIIRYINGLEEQVQVGDLECK